MFAEDVSAAVGIAHIYVDRFIFLKKKIISVKNQFKPLLIL